MGTHPFGDSLVNTGGNELTPLSHIANAFPFLLKILDVKDMLSIQVHPSKAGAEEGFAKRIPKVFRWMRKPQL